MGCRLPPGLRIVTVPCAGSVSLENLLSAFQAGADGVAVLTCHSGNCFSEQGNAFAHRRVDQVAGLLPQIGFEPGRLVRHTLAANMGADFAETMGAFEQTLNGTGPQPVHRGLRFHYDSDTTFHPARQSAGRQRQKGASWQDSDKIIELNNLDHGRFRSWPCEQDYLRDLRDLRQFLPGLGHRRV